MSRRVRPAVAAFMVTVVVVGMSIPARADAPGAPGPDPSPYTPPFALSNPVEGEPRFSDTFGAIRDQGDRLHHGIDIGSPTETPVLAAAPGVISRISVGATAGLFVEIRHAGGWHTRYLHLNEAPPPEPETSTEGAGTDELPGFADSTEDSVSEDPGASAPGVTGWGIPLGIEVGAEVAAGDVVGYVGYSGNASSEAPHVHFELRMPDGTPVNPHPFLTGIAEATTLYVVPDITDEPITESMNFVGHADPGDGFNSAVWAYAGVAYLGSYGDDGACPASGVRRYDVADPTDPVELGPISEGYPGTWTPALWVGDVATSSFTGILAVVAHRTCEADATGSFGGLALYDVTDPAQPEALGTYDAGFGTRGVGGLDVWLDGESVLVGAVVPNSLLDHADAVGDVRIIEISDPRVPIDIADWDFRRDVIGEIAAVDDDPRALRAEGITVDPDGHRAFVAQWDGGIVVLDLATPGLPKFAGWRASAEHEEGNAASTAFDADRHVLAVTYQDLDPLADEIGDPRWGFVALLSVDGRAEFSLISQYMFDDATPDGEGRIPLDGVYTAHRGVITGQRLYAAWASAGLRVVDLADPEQPLEIASFVPPTQVDPQRQLTSPNGNIAMPLVWSVHVSKDLIYVSDLNTGLWILELTEPPGRGERRATSR